MNNKITKIRKKIDRLDAEILNLLNGRAECALKIGELKKTSFKAAYVPSREADVFDNLIKANGGPLPKEAIKHIYKEIMSACRGLEAKLKIAYLGPQGTFSHQAGIKKFGMSAEYIPCATLSDVITEVEKNRVNFGVVPVENSTEGSVNHTLDMLVDTNLSVINEIHLRVEHCLLSKTKPANIDTIYSHEQAIAQCRNWLTKNLPNIKIIPVSSTAQAAYLASQNKKSAAIASVTAAGIYSLNILVKGIEDSRDNWTRFFVLGHIPAKQTKNDKTSIIFMIKDKVNALHDILSVFGKANINLTKIESRPTKKRIWEYVFFVDFIGHIEDKKVAAVIEKVKHSCVFLKILGSYPKD